MNCNKMNKKQAHLFVKNKKDVNIEKKIIIPYSDRNSNTNPLLEYSILNPEISSLSPSLKSKGARLHSAIILIIHTGNINRK